jgi:hypothetical protein
VLLAVSSIVLWRPVREALIETPAVSGERAVQD